MKTTLHNRLLTARLRARYLFASFVLLFLLEADARLARAVEKPPHEPGQKQTPSGPIPWSEIGASAGAQYQGDGLVIVASERGVVLRCVFQKLEGVATTAGLWLTSTATDKVSDRFRVTAMSVGRAAEVSGEVQPSRGDEFIACDAVHARSLPRTGTVALVEDLARFVRPGLVEEYSVSMDGVRQDFIITQKPAGGGELRLELDVDGARAEAASYSAGLVLEGSGRRIAYSRLHAQDAQGRTLDAHIGVTSASHMVVLVDDTAAVYPVRIDPTFSDENWISMGTIPGADGYVQAVAIDGSGSVYVGGSFTLIGDVFVNNVARWNGSAWLALGSGVNERVSALAVSGSNLYVAGAFTTAGGIPAASIAKWDGNAWINLGSGIHWMTITYPPVLALAVSGSDLYVGGGFTYAGEVPARNIAKWNGSAWFALGDGMDSSVWSLAVSGSAVYAGGYFSTAGGSPANYIAKWNGTAWSALGSGVNNRVIALAVSGGDVYAGGEFTSAGGNAANYIAKWNGNSWTPLGLGMGGGIYPYVYSLAVSGSDVYAGGDFTTAGGTTVTHIAKWTGAAWTGLGQGVNSRVNALVVSAGGLYAGGHFTTAGGIGGRCLAKWDGSAWTPLAPGSGLNGVVNALAVSGSELYAAGEFTTADGTGVNHIARRNGISWSALSSGLDGSVYALGVSGSNIFAGGAFATAGGSAANNVAKWDGSSWSALGLGVNGLVIALAASGGELYVGGRFTVAGGTAATNIAKWDGSAWSALGSGLSGVQSGRDEPPAAVYALAVSGSDLYAGGRFLTAGGNDAYFIAKWDGRVWASLGTGLNGVPDFGAPVSALTLSGNDVYAGGGFGYAGDSTANLIAKWDGSNWSALGSGLGDGYYPHVSALAVSGSDVYVAGSFMSAGDSGANSIANWNGTNWTSLGSGLNGEVHALAVIGCDMYVGGSFSAAGQKASAYIARAHLPTLPTLSVRCSGSEATVSWPSFYRGFVLQQNRDVANPYSWSNANYPLTTNGAINSVSVPISPGNQFFRLFGN